MIALKIKKNVKSIKKVEAEFQTILALIIDEQEKISKLASLIVESQSETKDLIKWGFSGLAIKNAQLLDDNKHFKIIFSNNLKIFLKSFLKKK